MFALNEPRVFQLLFMNEGETVPYVKNVLPLLDESYDRILHSIMSDFSIEEKSAERIYRHLWIYTHGIACLCATKTCRFEQADIQEMLTELFLSLLKNAKEQR